MIEGQAEAGIGRIVDGIIAEFHDADCSRCGRAFVCRGGRRAPLCAACQAADDEQRTRRAEELNTEQRVRAALREVESAEGQAALCIPPDYHGAALEDFPAPGVAPLVRTWLADAGAPCTLFISGLCGVGKTRMLFAIVRRLHVSLVPYRRERVAGLIRRLQVAVSRSVEQEAAAVREVCDFAGVLMLDDLGASKLTDYGLSVVGEVIDVRQEWHRRTVVTSNLVLGDISTRVSERIASRLASGERVQLGGSDWRLARREKA